jgi:uncharacterized integral membrane protein
MGYKQEFQPLTRTDTITVVLYRVGIVISTIIISSLAYVLMTAASNYNRAHVVLSVNILMFSLFASVGISVFFIHLYVRKFKIYLKILYFLSLGCLVVIISLGRGSLSSVLVREPYSSLLLLPLSGCLSFVTAKEAVCFALFEGYLLAIVMPIYLLLIASSTLTSRGASYGLVFIAALLVIFTLRKVFMPIAYDIGDKTAYH